MTKQWTFMAGPCGQQAIRITVAGDRYSIALSNVQAVSKDIWPDAPNGYEGYLIEHKAVPA